MPAAKKTKATEAKKVDFDAMSVADLEKLLATKQQDQLEAKKSHKAGELINPRVITQNRKDIARIKTSIRAKQLTKEEK